jgi:hypothetical protein
LDRCRHRNDRCGDAGVRLHQTDLDDRECAAFPEFVDNHRRRAGALPEDKSLGGYAVSSAFDVGTGQQAVEVVGTFIWLSKEDAMAVQIVMDHTGDTRHHFNPADARAVAEAEARFMELTGAGFTAAKRLGEGKSQVLKSFDPTAQETLFIPRLQGG